MVEICDRLQKQALSSQLVPESDTEESRTVEFYDMVMHMPSERRAQGTHKPRTRSASLQLKSGEWRPQEIAGLQSEASGSPQDEQSKEGPLRNRG